MYGLSKIFKGGAGSGNWNGPGDPRFAADSKEDNSDSKLREIRTGDKVTVDLYRGEGTSDYRIASQYAVGQYWSPHKEVAETYGTSVRTISHTLENPYVFTLPGKLAYFQELRKEFGTDDPQKITDMLKDKGYDALVVRNVPVMRGDVALRDSIEVILLNEKKGIKEIITKATPKKPKFKFRPIDRLKHEQDFRKATTKLEEKFKAIMLDYFEKQKKEIVSSIVKNKSFSLMEKTEERSLGLGLSKVLGVVKGGPGSGNYDSPGQPRFAADSKEEIKWAANREQAKVKPIEDILKETPLATAIDGDYTKWIVPSIDIQNDPDRLQAAGTMFIRQESTKEVVKAGYWMDYPEKFSIKEMVRYSNLSREQRAAEEMVRQKEWGFKEDFDLRKKLIAEGKHEAIPKTIKDIITKASPGALDDRFDFSSWSFDRAKWDVMLQKYGGEYIKEMYDLEGTRAYDGLQYQMEDLAGGFNVDDPNVQEFLDDYTFQFAQDINDTTEEFIRDSMKSGMDDGLSMQGIADLIAEDPAFDDARAMLIARTETIRASNTAADMAYQQSGIVNKKEWLVTDDDRLCPACAEMDGEQIDVGDNFFDKGESLDYGEGDNAVSMKFDYGDVGGPPLHPNCRCVLVPSVDLSSLEEGDTEETGFVPPVTKGGPGSGSWEAPGEPRFAYEGEKISSGLKSEAMNRVFGFMQGRKDNTEMSMIVINGRVVSVRGEDNDSRVEFTSKQFKNMEYMVHNHPGGASFSGDDVAFLINAPNLKEMNVLTPNGTLYSLEKMTNQVYGRVAGGDTAKAEWNSIMEELEPEFYHRFKEGEDSQVLWVEHTHKVMEKLSLESNLIYKRQLNVYSKKILNYLIEKVIKQKTEKNIILDDTSIANPPYNKEKNVTKGGSGFGNFDHAGRPGEVGGSGDGDSTIDISSFPKDAKDISHEQRMSQAEYSDISSNIARDLSDIQGDKPDLKQLEGELSQASLKDIKSNMNDELKSYSNYLAGDTALRARDYIDGFNKTVHQGILDGSLKGIKAEDLNKLGLDSIRKLMYQEVESNRQAFTDHGIRHIEGDVARAQQIAEVLNPTMTGKEALMINFALVNHDVGYTVPLIRDGGLRGVMLTKDHPEFSEKIAQQQENKWNQDKIFTKEEYGKITEAIRTHDATDTTGSNFLTAIRTSDNLSLFNSEKLPSMFKYVSGGDRDLVAMGLAASKDNKELFDKLKTDLHDKIDKTSLNENLKRDLKSATKEITYMTPKFTLGVLAGYVSNIKATDSGVGITVRYNSHDVAMQKLFDMGQKQTKKFLNDYGITDFSKTSYDIGDKIKLNVEGYTGPGFGSGKLPKRVGLQRIVQKDWEIIKGGANSGNYSHSGRPGQVGGSGSDEVTEEVYHGTTKKLLDNIMINGLKPQSSTTFDSEYYTGDRAKSVFVASDPSDAFFYAKMACTSVKSNQGVVLEISIPKSIKLELDESHNGKEVAYKLDEIKPDWIKGYTPFKLNKDGQYQIGTYVSKKSSNKYFVPVVIVEENTTKGGPGSGSWEAPGDPRFAHEGEDIKPSRETIVYHGTSSRVLNSILQDGLKPGRATINTSKGSIHGVFMIPNEKVARSYSSNQWRNLGPGAKSVVFEIALPKSIKVHDDPGSSKGGVFHEGIIPSKYIKSYSILEDEVWVKTDLQNKKEADSVFFVPVVIVERKQKSIGLSTIIKGGPGSGNFGHSGRPGEIGGSGEGGQEESGSKTPITQSDKDFKSSIDQMNKMISSTGNREGYVYNSGYDLVSKEGKFYTPQERPKDIPKGQDKECYRNASLLALGNPEYTYVEGFAQTDFAQGLPFAHAWCVDKSGNVIDPTWKTPGISYYGIAFKTKYLEETLVKTKTYGMIPEMPSKKYNPFKDGFPSGAFK